MTRFYVLVLLYCVLLGTTAQAQLSDKLGIGFNVSAQKLYGDTRTGEIVYGGNPLLVRYNFTPTFFLDGDFGFSHLRTSVNGTRRTSKIVHFGVKAGYRFHHDRRLNPLVYLGAGILNFQIGNGAYYWDGYATLGAGFEYFISRSFGLNTSLDFRYTSGDDFDGGRIAAGRDAFFKLAVGMNYYFGLGGRKQAGELHSDSQNHLSPVEEVTALLEPEADPAANQGSLQYEMLGQKENLLKELEERDETLRLLKSKSQVMANYLKQLKQSGVSFSNGTYHHLSTELQDALFLYASGDYDRAAGIFLQLIEQERDAAMLGNLWFWLGENHFASGNFQAAVAAFQTAGNQELAYPRELTNQMMLGLSKIKNDEISAGYTILRQVLKKDLPREYEDLINDYLAQVELLPEFQL